MTIPGTEERIYKFLDDDTGQEVNVLLPVRDIIFFKLLDKIARNARTRKNG